MNNIYYKMEDNKSKICYLKYNALMTVLGGITAVGIGGLLYETFFNKDKKEIVDLDANVDAEFKHCMNGSSYGIEKEGKTKFEKIINNIKNKIGNNTTTGLLPEEIVLEIIGVIKEYSDYLFDVRYKEYNQDRRRTLVKSEKSEHFKKKYEDYCRDYFDLYNFSLRTSRKEIMSKIGVAKKFFAKSWDVYSNKEFIYFKINYYSNIFNNFEIVNLDKLSIKHIFEQYSDKLIKEVHKLENFQNDISTEEYAIKLNFIKLKLGDEMFNKFSIDDKDLRFLAITIYELDKEYSLIKDLLEKINGIELISIGFS